jgi:hypothetical protein
VLQFILRLNYLELIFVAVLSFLPFSDSLECKSDDGRRTGKICLECLCYALIAFAYVKVFAKTHTNADYWKDHQKASARSGLECAASVSIPLFFLDSK